MVKKMKKVILLSIMLIFLTGCSYGGLYNISNFVLPDDVKFLAIIQELNTPEKICQYMTDNFETEEHPCITLNPYRLYLTKKGDCNDFSTFAIFIAHHHGYETYLVLMQFDVWHAIAIYKEGNCYTFSDNQTYYSDQCYTSFDNITQIYNGYSKYIVYDYWNDIVEEVDNN